MSYEVKQKPAVFSVYNDRLWIKDLESVGKVELEKKALIFYDQQISPLQAKQNTV